MEQCKLFTRGIIQNEEGKVLLVQKNMQQKIAPGQALLLGGTVEFGETMEETLKRQIFEEVGLEVTNIGRVVKTQTMILGDVYWFGVYYEVTTKNLEYKNMEPEKHERVFWGGESEIG